MAVPKTPTDEIIQIREQFYKLDSDEFEYFVASLWEIQGWQTRVTKRSGDGGVDVIAKKHQPIELRLYIEVKKWKSKPIGIPEVQRYSLAQGADADCAIIVTSSIFTEDAIDEAREARTKTIDGIALAELVTALEAEDLLSAYLEVADVSTVQIEDYVRTDGQQFSSPQYTELAGVISGIHAGHADRLAEEGIDTIEDLAEADVESLEEALDIPASRLSRWVKSAQYLHSRPVNVLPKVGAGRKKDLENAGIMTLGDLAAAKTGDIANALNVTEDTADQYRRQAVERPEQLVTEVDQIGVGKGTALRAAGIKTIADLVASDPDVVASQLDGITPDFLRDRIEDA